jgi:tripartite-type tricarboxylate transporter receptor subunit TctC
MIMNMFTQTFANLVEGSRDMRLAKVLTLVGSAFLASGAAQAQQFAPTQPVRILVPFGPGSVTDTLARIIGDKLSQLWKQTVVVENRPGPPGITAAAKSTADGYTLMLTSNGHVIANVINKNVTFDPVADFAGVTRLVEAPFVMISNPKLPVKTLPDFLALARKEPGKYNFSSAGIASTSFLMAETLRQAANLNLVHVPFKGTPDAVSAVLRGDVAFYMAPLPDSIEQAKVDNVRMLAITSSQRQKQVPDLPTVTEAVPNFTYEAWFGLLAPAATPKDIVAKINADAHAVLMMPDVMQRLVTLGSIATPNTPAEFDALIKADAAKYAGVMKAAGLDAN